MCFREITPSKLRLGVSGIRLADARERPNAVCSRDFARAHLFLKKSTN